METKKSRYFWAHICFFTTSLHQERLLSHGIDLCARRRKSRDISRWEPEEKTASIMLCKLQVTHTTSSESSHPFNDYRQKKREENLQKDCVCAIPSMGHCAISFQKSRTKRLTRKIEMKDNKCTFSLMICTTAVSNTHQESKKKKNCIIHFLRFGWIRDR